MTKKTVTIEELAFRLWIEYRYLSMKYDFNLPHRIHPVTKDAIVEPKWNQDSMRYAGRLYAKIKLAKQDKQIPAYVWNRARDEVNRYKFSIIELMYNEYEGIFYLQPKI